MAWLRLGPCVRCVTFRCKVHRDCVQLWVPMGRGTTKMGTGWGCQQRQCVSLEKAVVDHRAVVMCERQVCKNQQGDWRKRERSWSLGWKDLRVCGFCQTLFVKEPTSQGQSRNFSFPTFLIAKTRMRESQNYCLPVGLFFPLKLLPKFFTLGVLNWNAMNMT